VDATVQPVWSLGAHPLEQIADRLDRGAQPQSLVGPGQQREIPMQVGGQDVVGRDASCDVHYGAVGLADVTPVQSVARLLPSDRCKPHYFDNGTFRRVFPVPTDRSILDN